MSNTRRASGNGPLRQERFASSQEYERGLMANLVAKRCTVLESSADRELVWYLQGISHREGLKRFARALCERFQERVATPAMRLIGMKPRQVYNAGQVKRVRAEIVGAHEVFLLRGESRLFEVNSDELSECLETELPHEARAASQHPTSYPATDFVERCRAAADEHLEKGLAELCLDPSAALADGEPWYFPTLISTLRGLLAEQIEQSRAAVAVTAIGKEVCAALDYALASGRLVLVDGLARTGKTFAAKAWCAQHPGQVRYVQVPATNDDFAFYRAVAVSLGVSINLKSKSQELRGRIEETLQSARLMLVLDEAHYLWPQSNYRHTTPGRVNWLMTALVNFGVPVALITTPQFFRSQQEIEQSTHWTSEQFTGRIGHYQKLPDSLSRADLVAVAKTLLPNGDARCIEALAVYAESSTKYLAGIEAAVARAQYITSREQRDKVTLADVKQAIRESLIPSDRTLATALTPPGKPSRKRAICVPARPLQTDFQAAEEPAQSRRFQFEPVRETTPLVEALS